MEYTTPEHSKQKVRKSGAMLVNSFYVDAGKTISEENFNNALEVLNNWRAAHAYPMLIIYQWLKSITKRYTEKPIIVQRLKRVRSILVKLIKEQKMSLDRMQDIGGCRVVLKNVSSVEAFHALLLKSRARHMIHNQKNYIENPAASGYRGIHIIYKYNASKIKFKNLLIEVQLRSDIQHSWATAVEVVGTFTNQALKSSEGDARWLEFFKSVSAEFAVMESRPLSVSLSKHKNIGRLNELMEKLDVINKLNTFVVLPEFGEVLKKATYCLLMLDTKLRKVSYKTYSMGEFHTASADYSKEEIKSKNDPGKDVVLVLASSINNLKQAYPNYFADTTKFVQNLLKVVS